MTSLFQSFQPHQMAQWRLKSTNKLDPLHSSFLFSHCFSLSVCTLCWHHTCLSLQTSLSSGWSNTPGLRGVPENRHKTGHAQPILTLFDQPPQKTLNPQLVTLFSSHPIFTLIPPDPQLPSASTSGCTDTCELFFLQYWQSTKLTAGRSRWNGNQSKTSWSFACFFVSLCIWPVIQVSHYLENDFVFTE